MSRVDRPNGNLFVPFIDAGTQRLMYVNPDAVTHVRRGDSDDEVLIHFNAFYVTVVCEIGDAIDKLMELP